jgi:hypothetical protein
MSFLSEYRSLAGITRLTPESRGVTTSGQGRYIQWLGALKDEQRALKAEEPCAQAVALGVRIPRGAQ